MRLYETGKPTPPAWKVLIAVAATIAPVVLAAMSIARSDWQPAAMWSLLSIWILIDAATDQILDRIDMRADGLVTRPAKPTPTTEVRGE